MTFNSHRRNFSLFSQNRQSIPTLHRSLRKINQNNSQQLALITAKQYYYQYNNMKAAINSFQEFLNSNPHSQQALYLCAIAYLQEQKPQMAIPKLQQYLSLRKSSQKVRKLIIHKEVTSLSNALLLLSTAYNKTGNIQKSFDSINQSIKCDIKYEEAYCYRAKLYMKIGDYSKAQNDYLNAIKLNTRSWTAYNGIADCYSARNQYHLAIKYYDKVIAFLSEGSQQKQKQKSLNQKPPRPQPNILQLKLKRNICLYQNSEFEESCSGLMSLLKHSKTSQVYYYIALNQLKILEEYSIEKRKGKLSLQRTSKCRIFSKQENIIASNKNSQNQCEQFTNTMREQAILNLQSSIKAQTNMKICGKASKLLIKTYIENYQFYEAVSVLELVTKLKINIGEYKNIVQGCMLVIKQKYEQAIPILKNLHKIIVSFTQSIEKDSSTQKNSPRSSSKRPFFQHKKDKKEIKKIQHLHEELIWMIPIILLFKAYSEFFMNNFIQCLESYDRYESHIRDYLGKDPETDIYLCYNKILCEGVLMLQNQMVEESLEKFLACIDQYYQISRGLPVQPIIFRILGMIKIALSDTPYLSEQIDSKTKIFLAVLEVIEHYKPAVKKSHLIYYYKGIILLALDQNDRGNDQLQTCLKLAQQCVWKYLYVKGVAELKRNCPQEAIKQFSAGLILDQAPDLYLGRCISYITFYHSEKQKQTVLIEKGFEDLQKFIQLQKSKNKISSWVTKILFFNGALEEVEKSLERITDKTPQIIKIQENINVFNGIFEGGGILGSVLINAFEGKYKENFLTYGSQKHEYDEDDYIDKSFKKWLKILNLYAKKDYTDLLKILQLSIFQQEKEQQILELKYNLVIVYFLLGQFQKAQKILSVLSKTKSMQTRVSKIQNRQFVQDECLPDLQEQFKGIRRLSYYLPYQSIVFPEQIKIFVKISLPFPIFEKPNLNLDIDDTFLCQETQQTCVPKKIEAPWIRKITGNIQFTETIVESDASLLYDDSYCPTQKLKSQVYSSSFSDLKDS